MTRLHSLLVMGLTLTLAACSPAAFGTTTPIRPTSPSGNATPIVITAIAGAVSAPTTAPAPPPPPDYTPPPTEIPPTATPIPTLPGGIGPTELKYRILEQYPNFFFCDPDYYPLARANELDLARQHFPELQANAEEFNQILAHHNLTGQTTFTDDQKLLIYRDHKRLAALQFELTPTGYQFLFQIAESPEQGELVSGLIDGQGEITNLQRTPQITICPVCLAVDTLIDTPAGPMPIQSLRVGTWVWTLNRAGMRTAQPLIQIGQTVVPATHQMVHLVLIDGRELWVSPGHPTTDGRAVGQLRASDFLDGARILSVERVPYTGTATYDILPAGDTGTYWANGILLASTLKNADH